MLVNKAYKFRIYPN
ncbi:helix-turn-helix domain-containing protein, partial [Bacillus thuringiensis]